MKNLFLLSVIFIFNTASVCLAQNEAENIFRPAEIQSQKNKSGKNYFLGSQSSVSLPGNGTFIYSSFAKKNAKGEFYQYNDNENHTTVITSADAADKVAIRFQYFETEANADFLYIYDGPTENSPLLAKLSGTLSHNKSFVSSGSQLTLKFVSNSNITATGFKIIASPVIKDITKNQFYFRTLACNGVPAADACAQAPVICNFNDYCGVTSAAYTVDNVPNFCGSLENNSWISFAAGSTTAIFAFKSGGCQDNNSGIQAAVYESSDCVTFNLVSDCISQGTSPGSFTIVTNVPLNVGQKYYLMIDGFAGNVCSYTVTGLSQSSSNNAFINSTYPEICPGYTTTLSSPATSSSYAWTDNFGNTYANQQSITVSPTLTTTYSLSIDPNSCGPGLAVRTITVNNVLTSSAINSPSIICAGQSVTLTTIPSAYNYSWSGPAGFVSSQSNPVISNFNATNNGTYSLQLSIDEVCTSTTTIKNITVAQTPTIGLITSVTSFCNFNSSSTITLTASGSTVDNGYIWNWNQLEGFMVTQSCFNLFGSLMCTNSSFSIPNQPAGPSATLTPNRPTTVCVVATGTNGCVSTSTCINITESSTASIQTSGSTNICRGDSTLIIATGTAPFTWTVPSNGGLISLSSDGDSLWMKPQTATTYTVRVSDTTPCYKTRFIKVNIDTLCVWPGDTDRDGDVDQNDLLPIGIYYGATDVVRPDQTINWDGHYCLPWVEEQAGGANLKNVDSDGNGSIGQADTLAVYQNVNLTHALRAQNIINLNTDVSIKFDKPFYYAGDTVKASLHLGLDTAQLNSFYGAAFKLSYDDFMIEPNGAKFNFVNSWVGSPLQDILTFNYFDVPTSQFLEAFVRNTHTNVSGYGKVAEAKFALLSTTSSSVFSVSFTDGIKTSNDFNTQLLGTITATVLVNPALVTVISKNESTVFSIYPNPTKGLLTMAASNVMQKIEVLNVAGQQLLTVAINEKTHQLHLENFAEGIYFVKVTYNNGMNVTKKVIKQ